jgi:hypothetical protein
MEKDARGPGFQRSPKAGSAGVGFASREGGCSQLGSFLRNGEEGRNLGEEGMLVEGQEEGRKEGRRDEIYSKSETWPGCWRRACWINQSARGVFGKGVHEVALRLSVPEPEAT